MQEISASYIQFKWNIFHANFLQSAYLSSSNIPICIKMAVSLAENKLKKKNIGLKIRFFQ